MAEAPNILIIYLLLPLFVAWSIVNHVLTGGIYQLRDPPTPGLHRQLRFLHHNQQSKTHFRYHWIKQRKKDPSIYLTFNDLHHTNLSPIPLTFISYQLTQNEGDIRAIKTIAASKPVLLRASTHVYYLLHPLLSHAKAMQSLCYICKTFVTHYRYLTLSHVVSDLTYHSIRS
jgi:hypothetical protein